MSGCSFLVFSAILSRLSEIICYIEQMTRKNLLSSAPPYEVETAIRGLGKNLRIARLRRNLTIEQVAQKIGTGARAVMDAEKGKASTGIAVYVALLWVYGLLDMMSELAGPVKDREETALEMQLAKRPLHRLRNNGASRSSASAANGLMNVTPPRVRPSCMSSLTIAEHSACRATAQIIASQNDNRCSMTASTASIKVLASAKAR